MAVKKLYNETVEARENRDRGEKKNPLKKK